MRGTGSSLHLADVPLVSPTCHRGTEIKSGNCEVCSLDMSLWGGFTKILAVSKTGLFESGLSPGTSVYNIGVFFHYGWCVSSLL